MRAPKRTQAGPTKTITNSGRSTFIRCRRRFYYQYEMWLTPKGVAFPLLVGGIFHRALASWYSAGSMEKARLTPVLRGVAEEIREARKELLGEQQLERLEVAHGMLIGLLTAYHSKYLAEDFERWKFVLVEKQFSYTLPNGWEAQGIIDLVAEDRQSRKGARWIWEHKTTSVLGEDYVGRLPLDDQIHHYWKGAREALGFEPAGIVYNVVQKSRLRQKQKERFQDFCSRVEADYVSDPGKYFWRGVLTIPKWSLKAYESELLSASADIDETRKKARVIGSAAYYKNTHHCFQFGACPFVPLCTSNESKEALAMFERKDSPHPELDRVEEEVWQ